MIDPFGWTGFPFSLLRRIGSQERSEVLVSFMYESINRFIEHPQQEENWRSLFGNDEWRDLPRYGDPQRRRDFLVELYQERLKEAGFRYQWRFELRDEGNRPEYFLVYGTQSIDGLSAMKEAMWKVAPDGSYRYSDFEEGSGQLKLFLGDPDPRVLGRILINNFPAGLELEKSQLREFTLVQTDFVERHLNRSLRALEAAGQVSIRRPPGRRASWLKNVWVTINE